MAEKNENVQTPDRFFCIRCVEVVTPYSLEGFLCPNCNSTVEKVNDIQMPPPFNERRETIASRDTVTSPRQGLEQPAPVIITREIREADEYNRHTITVESRNPIQQFIRRVQLLAQNVRSRITRRRTTLPEISRQNPTPETSSGESSPLSWFGESISLSDSLEDLPYREYGIRTSSEGLLNYEAISLGNLSGIEWIENNLDFDWSSMLFEEEKVVPPMASKKLANLPSMRVNQDQIDNHLRCSICCEDYKLQEEIKKLGCNHFFHPGCIMPWLSRHGTCPNCRTDFTEDSCAAPAIFLEPAAPTSRHSFNSGNIIRSQAGNRAQENYVNFCLDRFPT